MVLSLFPDDVHCLPDFHSLLVVGQVQELCQPGRGIEGDRRLPSEARRLYNQVAGEQTLSHRDSDGHRLNSNSSQLTTQFDILDWQKEFAERAKQDHQELVEHLSEMEAKQDLTNDILLNNNDMLRNLMTMMQTVGVPTHAVATSQSSCLRR